MNPHTATPPRHHGSAARWSTVKRSTILAPTAVALLAGLNADGPVLAQPELDPPTNLSALGSPTQIDIRWEENSRGETGFEVHRSATGAPNSFALHATMGSNVTAFSDQGLTPGEHFCHQVPNSATTRTV